MNEFELYKQAFKNNLIKEIQELEIPYEWSSKDIIRFIIKKIENGN